MINNLMRGIKKKYLTKYTVYTIFDNIYIYIYIYYA